MRNRHHIEQEVDKTLNSLDGIQRATANPYLFTRIKAGMQKEEGKGFWSMATGFISRPVVAIATILLIVLVNLAVFFQAKPVAIPAPQQDGEQLFASEYNLSGSTIYDVTVEQ